MNVVVYSKSNCVWCDRAKNLLNSVDLSFNEIDLSDDIKRNEFYKKIGEGVKTCLLYTSPSPRDATLSRMPSSA